VRLVTTIWTGRLRNQSSILGRGRILPPYLVENFRGLQSPLCGRRGPLPRVKAAIREAILTPLSCAHINHLTPNGHYMGRTAQLTSRRFILCIYSTNIRTEYFKHAA